MTAIPVRVKAYGYPTASQDPAGNWHAGPPDSVVTATWGTFRIEVGAVWDVTANPPTKTTPGTDVTVIGSTPTIIDSLSFGEPYSELTGSVTLPELSPFDEAAWLVPGQTIDIWHVVSGVDKAYWHGFIASIETSDGPGLSASVTLHLMGAMFGEISLRAHQPIMVDESIDIGSSLDKAIDVAAHSRPLPPFTGFYYESATTGINTRHRGSRGQMVIDYCDELLGLAQDSGGQWTISRAYAGSPTYPQARKYYLRLKSAELAGAVQQNTVFAGGYGVALSLNVDMSEQPNAIYGEGLYPSDAGTLSGSRWRNAKYPMLRPTVPAYPNHYPVDQTTGHKLDSDFTADVVTQLQAFLRMAGQPDVQITGIFDADTAYAVMSVKLDADWANVDGDVKNNSEWDLMFSASTATGTTEANGYFRPLAEVKESQPYLYRTDGAVYGDNDSGAHPYDGRIRVERVISFSESITKGRATTYAKRLVTQAQTPAWAGTVTLTSDPTDETAAARSRLDIREGSWIRVNNLAGGTHLDFYIAGVTQSPESDGFPTQLTVSQHPWDLLDLSTRLERDRTAHEDPAKSFYSLRTRVARPFRDVTGWDAESGAGYIPRTALSAGWNVIKFVGAQRGTIAAVSMTTRSAASKYAVALFGTAVTSGDLDGWVADPLAEYTDALGDSWWNVDAIQDDLTAHGFVEAWGQFGAGCGYSPGSEGTDPPHSVTGKTVDAKDWTFVSTDPPFLWLAVWATTTCTFDATMRVVIEE